MGKKFGKEWELDVSSPAEALRLIDANSPGLKHWIVDNREKYAAYKIICVYDTGVEEALSDETFLAQRTNLVSIRFTPTVAGAGGGLGKIVVGALLLGAALFNPLAFYGGTALLTGALGTAAIAIGSSLVLSGVIELLSPRPKTSGNGNADDSKSYYFDGATNTELQGNPVPLIYGRVLVGSHPISASISVDEIAP
jgi:predicted phage tail protein